MVFLRFLLITALLLQQHERPEIRVSELEQRIHELISIERQNLRLPVLKLDSRLSDIARGHSRDMAVRHFIDHVNPEGKDPTKRGRAAGYECKGGA